MRGRKLGRNASHRKAMFRNMACSLIRSVRVDEDDKQKPKVPGRIVTTVAKAKVARGLAEKMITLGKRGDLHSRRQASSYVMTPAGVKKLFNEVAQRYRDRRGGYTRLTRTGWRAGDGADTAILELVGTEVFKKRAEARAARAAARQKTAEAAAEQEKGRPQEEEK